MKTWEQINEKIESGKAVVLTAEEIIDYVDRKGLTKAAEEVDVVTTATFGPMCSSGCFLNFGHSIPRIRITEAWIDDVPVYSGVAAVDVYLGATELRQDDPKNLYHPGEFRFGGAHVMEKLVAGEELQLFALSYGTDDYPLKELRTYFTIHDLNQAIMVNPRNCYQNYNVAVNSSDKPIYSYLGLLKPEMGNIGYSSAGQLSPLLNDPLYLTIGVGTTVWLAGAKGMVFSEGTQHAPTCIRGQNDVPMEGAGTLALTGNMKEKRKEDERGVSLPVRDEEIMAGIIDYSHDYQYKTGKIVARVSYAELKSGEVVIDGKKIPTGSLSSYAKAREIAGLLADEIRRGDFLLSRPIRPLPSNQTCRGLAVKERSK